MTNAQMFTLLREDISDLKRFFGEKSDALEARVREQNGRIGKSEARHDAAALRLDALEKINGNDETRPITRGQVRLVWWTLAAGFSAMGWLAMKFGPALVKLAAATP